jgi:hypothetical protein
VAAGSGRGGGGGGKLRFGPAHPQSQSASALPMGSSVMGGDAGVNVDVGADAADADEEHGALAQWRRKRGLLRLQEKLVRAPHSLLASHNTAAIAASSMAALGAGRSHVHSHHHGRSSREEQQRLGATM